MHKKFSVQNIPKKAQAETVIDFTKLIINFGLVVIVAVFMLIVLLSFLNTEYKTHSFEAKLLTKSLISSENCLAYNDKIKTYNGVIDLEKFSNERLKNCFSNPRLAYTLRLFDLEKNEIKFSAPEHKLLDFLNICSPLKEYKCSTNHNYVLYSDKN